MKEFNRINNIKKFSELFDKTNEEIVYQPTTDVDRTKPPKGDEIFYTEEDMRNSYDNGQENINYTDEDGIYSDETFDEWIKKYNLKK